MWIALAMSLAVLPGATSAAPSAETQAAVDGLLKADAFQGAAIGIAGTLSDGVRAFRILARDKEAAAHFDRIAREGTPAGRLYALAGLYVVDPAAYRRLRQGAVSPETKVQTTFGCIMSQEDAATLLRRIDNGDYSAEFLGAEKGSAWVEKWVARSPGGSQTAVDVSRNEAAASLSGNPRFDTRFTVTLPYTKADARGLPDASELPSLSHIEDLLTVRLQSRRTAVVALKLTGAKARRFVFYTRDVDWAGEVVKQVNSEVPARTLSVASEADPGWTLYKSFALVGAAGVAWPFGAWQRLSPEPILGPEGESWEAAGVFNPTVVRHGGQIVMLYRAQDRSGTSRLGYASSADGIHFTRRAEPVLSPEADYERDGGVEDPRLVAIDGTFYLTYTGYNKKDAQLCLATSKDLVHWDRRGVILPAYQGRWNKGWTKAGAIVPEKIGGRWWMYYLGTAADKTDQMGLASSSDLLHWTDALDAPVLPRRAGRFDSRVVEPGPAPVLTDDGIVLVYNGADDALVYRTAYARFDRHDPRRLLARSDEPVFAPETAWETTGQVPNVVFVEGLLRDGARWLFYYGGADKYVGVATAPAP